ncbi:FHA domain-containing protein [Apiospora saccharicola]|uniref:FHA domain-containing protein n=1 Tax=Apiospora saccharicola TaxID=335842 RepID=A0ABR1VLB4_9PEZI
MWLLENEGEAFEGKRLWLRPGKRYLFGRTVAERKRLATPPDTYASANDQEAGQLAIKGPKANTVSRKHVTISVDPVKKGDSQSLLSRSKVTVEDLGSKLGTTINEHKIKGETYVIKQDNSTLQMGSFPNKFKITWFPVVLSYSFTKKQLQDDPLGKLRQNLEQLDIKFISEYDVRQTTHVVSRKRNTSKGLQALINGRYIVDYTFPEAIVAAATPERSDDGVDRSILETDFVGNWPEAMQHLPPAGNEPTSRPAQAFAPNAARAELFEGYTFVFYDRGQYDSLLGPITNGKGKALFEEVVLHETAPDDFVRRVRGLAGEKGVGDNGNEGRGALVVKFLPQTPENPDIQQWYSDFQAVVAAELDYRMIDQKEFLDAILGSDASVLRRAPEVAPQKGSQPPQQPAAQSRPTSQAPADGEAEGSGSGSQPSMARRRPVRAVASRFKGFVRDDSSDDEMQDSAVDTTTTSVSASVPVTASAAESQGGLFVSQEVAPDASEEPAPMPLRSQRKRPAPSVDLLEEFAPGAALLKRRRIEAGEDPAPRPTQSAKPTAERPAVKTKAKAAKKNQEIDILEMANKHREEEDARAAAERAELKLAPEDLDLAEIRRLQIEEPMELRQAVPLVRSRDQDIADGRWDPRWNGLRNYKRFQPKGAVGAARPPQRIIVGCDEVKAKTAGIGDNYWLEDNDTQKRREKEKRSQNSNMNTMTTFRETQSTRRNNTISPTPPPLGRSRGGASAEAEAADDMMEDDEDDDIVFSASTRSRSTRGAATQKTSSDQQSQRSQRTTQASIRTSTKRPAAAPPPKEQPTKRSKTIAIPASDEDDESEDELRFRFKKR